MISEKYILRTLIAGTNVLQQKQKIYTGYIYLVLVSYSLYNFPMTSNRSSLGEGTRIKEVVCISQCMVVL